MGSVVFCLLVLRVWFWFALAPAQPNASPVYFRIKSGTTLEDVYRRLEGEGLLRSVFAGRFYAKIFRKEKPLRSATFLLSPSWRGERILDEIFNGTPITQRVLIREGLTLKETASLLDRAKVAAEAELLECFRSPERFASAVSFPLPSDSLEGYLFPDTYEMPPLLGAEEATRMMLRNFDKKVYERLGKPKRATLHQWIIIASLVEREAQRDEERAKIAGVIYNRLARNMPLQVDATVQYAKGSWQPITRKDYQIPHPYNTYRIKGLPPGPICSPGWKSILSAVNPETHDFLYYVASGDGFHSFSRDYLGHLENIRHRNRRNVRGRTDRGIVQLGIAPRNLRAIVECKNIPTKVMMPSALNYPPSYNGEEKMGGTKKCFLPSQIEFFDGAGHRGEAK